MKMLRPLCALAMAFTISVALTEPLLISSAEVRLVGIK
jgi:hypothetical protein